MRYINQLFTYLLTYLNSQQVTSEFNGNDKRFGPIIWNNSGKPASELSETLIQYITLSVLKFLSSTAYLPFHVCKCTSSI